MESAITHGPDGSPRARGLGVEFDGTPGPLNAITDVGGVEVGYATLIEGDGPLVVGEGPVRTGVTVVAPLGRGVVGTAIPAGWFSLNGNGEMTGTTWIEECGALSLPVAITNTHSVGSVHRGIIDWVVAHHPSEAHGWLLPVVAETWDGRLNDIDGDHVRAEHVAQAFDAATSGALLEGSVGGGTGMVCYGFKGGTGTSSRRVEIDGRAYTVGVITQANFGARDELRVRGVALGRRLAAAPDGVDAPPGAGSCIVVVATNAPLLPGQCKALARRVPLGLARTGTSGSHYSGDIFLAFSTANPGQLDSGLAANAGGLRSLEFLPWGAMDLLYQAVVEATEEAVLNVLAASRTMVGRDGITIEGFPLERLAER